MADSPTPPPTQQNSGIGLRKRQQIASSNKAMFVWVACASVLVAFSLVISIFLIKQILFTERVLIEKGKTVQTLKTNIETADDLNKEIKKLRANKNLTTARSSASDNNLDVVIDALPYAEDSVALGASLQKTLLTDISLEALASQDANSTTGTVDLTSIESAGDALPIGFTFKVTGTSDQLEKLFERLNRSIRPIRVVSLQLESAGSGKLTATAEAVTFYQPKKDIKLSEKVIKP